MINGVVMTSVKATLWCSVILLAACVKPGGDAQPARIIEPTEASRAALQQVLARALKVEVVVAKDALTESSKLVLEPAARRHHARLQGRDLDKPERFFLLMEGGECLLEHERSGERYRLEDTRCEPE